MKLRNAIKKLAKHGDVQKNERGREYWAVIGNHVVSFLINGPDLGGDTDTDCFHVKQQGEKDDHMTDYFCGTYFDNLKQAIEHVYSYEKYSKRMEATS